MGAGGGFILASEVMKLFGFYNIRMVEQFHKETERLIYVLESGGQKEALWKRRIL